MSASLHINFGGNFWQTQGFSVGRTASVGDTSARAADTGFARRCGAKGGENPSRLFLAAPGTFHFTVAIRYFAVGFKLFATGWTLIFIDWHNSVLPD
jgi:hypothetical protein